MIALVAATALTACDKLPLNGLLDGRSMAQRDPVPFVGERKFGNMYYYGNGSIGFIRITGDDLKTARVQIYTQVWAGADSEIGSYLEYDGRWQPLMRNQDGSGGYRVLSDTQIALTDTRGNILADCDGFCVLELTVVD